MSVFLVSKSWCGRTKSCSLAGENHCMARTGTEIPAWKLLSLTNRAAKQIKCRLGWGTFGQDGSEVTSDSCCPWAGISPCIGSGRS